jgi:alkyl sulfatase BDS1-like metallo-beta-lactamase superfamily hydrolase
MPRHATRICLSLSMLTLLTAAATADPKPASDATKRANAAVRNELPFANSEDFELAEKGLLARPESLVIRDASGRVVWDMDSYAFLKTDPVGPDTVNPSLWRQARLNMHYGLYRVVDGIYQVRGYDLANMTLIRGDEGWIVFDPLTTRETAAAAFALVSEHLGERPIKAVVYSHSHADHWGGVGGIVTAEQVASGAVRIIAPEGFLHHAISENVLAGNAMSRRVTYQYGSLLAKSPTGQVDAAIGKGVSTGTPSLFAPTDTVSQTPTRIVVDGVEMIFQNTPFTEAPAEMNTWLPGFQALWMAENCTGTMHNLYTLRGAEVRDASAWSKYINAALELFAAEAKVVFASHSWPRWGNDSVVHYLKKQRDLYGYVHDQTLRLANHGHTMVEIAEMLEIPPDLSHEWFNRGYHGSYNHNIKAVYQKYLGWYGGNPAQLHPLPPTEAAVKYVEYMGGAEAVIEKAIESYEAGEYRWVAMVLDHLIFADPTNRDARRLQADALEQLGYRAESAGWRNSYLMAAKELRDGVEGGIATKTASADTMSAMTIDMLFDYLGVRLDGPRAAGRTIVLNFDFPDTGAQYVLTLENSHLSYVAGRRAEAADATLSLARATLDRVLLGLTTLEQAAEAGDLTVEGDPEKIRELLGLLDDFEFWFDIVTP